MPSDLRHQSTYFEQLAGRYADGFAIGISFIDGVRRAITPHVHGDVLDIGNGGLLGFDVARVTSLVIADLCPASLRVVKTLEDGRIRALHAHEMQKLRRVGANALQLPFGDGVFDVVVMSYVGHHLSVASRRGSQDNFAVAVTELHRVLRYGGKLLLLENCPTRLPKCFQEVVFGLAFRILLWFGKPLPYFFSARQIEHLLARLRFRLTARNEIPWSARVHSPIFPALAPPGWLWKHVLKNRMFVAAKDHSPRS